MPSGDSNNNSEGTECTGGYGLPQGVTDTPVWGAPEWRGIDQSGLKYVANCRGAMVTFWTGARMIIRGLGAPDGAIAGTADLHNPLIGKHVLTVGKFWRMMSSFVSSLPRGNT